MNDGVPNKWTVAHVRAVCATILNRVKGAGTVQNGGKVHCGDRVRVVGLNASQGLVAGMNPAPVEGHTSISGMVGDTVPILTSSIGGKEMLRKGPPPYKTKGSYATTTTSSVGNGIALCIFSLYQFSDMLILGIVKGRERPVMESKIGDKDIGDGYHWFQGIIVNIQATWISWLHVDTSPIDIQQFINLDESDSRFCGGYKILLSRDSAVKLLCLKGDLMGS